MGACCSSQSNQTFEELAKLQPSKQFPNEQWQPLSLLNYDLDILSKQGLNDPLTDEKILAKLTSNAKEQIELSPFSGIVEKYHCIIHRLTRNNSENKLDIRNKTVSNNINTFKANFKTINDALLSTKLVSESTVNIDTASLSILIPVDSGMELNIQYFGTVYEILRKIYFDRKYKVDSINELKLKIYNIDEIWAKRWPDLVNTLNGSDNGGDGNNGSGGGGSGGGSSVNCADLQERMNLLQQEINEILVRRTELGCNNGGIGPGGGFIPGQTDDPTGGGDDSGDGGNGGDGGGFDNRDCEQLEEDLGQIEGMKDAIFNRWFANCATIV